MDEKNISEILKKSQSRVDLYNEIIKKKFAKAEEFIEFERRQHDNNFLKINEDNITLILDIQLYKNYLHNEIS